MEGVGKRGRSDEKRHTKKHRQAHGIIPAGTNLLFGSIHVAFPVLLPLDRPTFPSAFFPIDALQNPSGLHLQKKEHGAILISG